MENSKRFMPGQWSRFITSHWVYFCLGISLAVRFVTLGYESFWYDEAFTAFSSSLSFPNMLRAIAGDTHPPIWYALSWISTQITGIASPFVLRVPSAIFSALCVPELYKIVRRYIGNNEAVLASGMLAILPGQVYYGQEARMYSLLTLLVLFTANSVATGKWLRVALGGVLMMYTHNMAILYVVPLGIWSLISSKGSIARYWYIALAYLPWVGVLREQMSAMSGNGFWIVNDTPGGMLYFLEYTTLFNRLPAWAHYHGAIVAIAITVMSLWALRRELITRTGILAALGLAPAGELYVIGQLWRPMMLDRLLLPAGAFVVAIWAAGFIRMSDLSKRVALTLFVPILTLSIVSYYGAGFRTDYRQALQPIWDNWQDGDTVYHNSLSSVVLLRGELPADGYILPGMGDLSQSLSEPTKAAMGIKAREITVPQVRALGYRRLWVLYLITPMTSQHEERGILAVVDKYPVVDQYDVGSDQFVTFRVYLLSIDHDERAYKVLPVRPPIAHRPIH